MMNYSSNSHIRSASEVAALAHHIYHEMEWLDYHPDDPCDDPLLDRLVSESFAVCEREDEDIYQIFSNEVATYLR
ncbi:MAG: hypothetical protein II633_04215 [Bacteroidales bacterium]|jgi:hypothetical protein|nr:hypothetical protein [Bacteroidales bacterium]